MKQDKLKQQAAEAAIDLIKNESIIGVGTGSTVDFFIEALASMRGHIEGAVASSNKTAARLKELRIPILDLNAVGDISVYVDGADEVNESKQMIKGGGGACTKEKIVASAAKKFICIIDVSKKVKRLGDFPVAVEVLPMARSFVGRQIVKLGGDPEYRHGFVTDSGNYILDVHNLDLTDALSVEQQLNNIPGVVENGIFAARPADIVICAAT